MIHALFELLAYSVAIRLYLYLKGFEIDPLTPLQRQYVIVAGGLGAFVGSKALGVLDTYHLWSELSFFQILFSGKTIVGGLLGGLIGVEIMKAYKGITVPTGDLFCFPLITGMIIGRIGCFLSGIHDGTHGTPTSCCLGMDLGDGCNRHPTSLYEIVFLIIMMITLKRKDLKPGLRFQIFMITYLMWRFLIDFLKPCHALVGPLSIIQLACGGGLFYYAGKIMRRVVR